MRLIALTCGHNSRDLESSATGAALSVATVKGASQKLQCARVLVSTSEALLTLDRGDAIGHVLAGGDSGMNLCPFARTSGFPVPTGRQRARRRC